MARTIAFERDVARRRHGRHAALRPACRQSWPPRSSSARRSTRRTSNLSEIECRGQVTIEHVSRDTGGVTSHERMQLGAADDQSANGRDQRRRAGRHSFDAVRQRAWPLIPGSRAASRERLVAPPPNAAGKQAAFPASRFPRWAGRQHVHARADVPRRVRTVYGPVDSWEQELDLTRPETLPPDSMTLTCDDLRMNEDPVAARAAPAPADGSKRPIGPVQMQAKGERADRRPGAVARRVQRAGRSGELRASEGRVYPGRRYAYAGEALAAHGSRRNSPPTEARKIRYVRSTGEIKVEGIQYFEITPSDIENARRPTGGSG